MKKFMLLLTVVCTVLLFSSCGDDEKSQKDIKSEKDYPRTVDISSGIKDKNEEFEYSADFNFDGKKEEVEIEFEFFDEYDWSYYMEVSIGEYKTKIEVEGNYIEAVYACDIDESDGVRDLVIFTNEMSGDPIVRILKYDSSLPLYNFVNDYDDTPYGHKWIGYAVNCYFNVNEDDSITMEEQTSSAGMWSVYKTYYRDENGIFVEKKPEYYDVLPDFMAREYDFIEDMGKEEKEKWKKGYIMAHTDYTSNGFTLYEGDYFKVLYDDGNNEIYVEKENGEGAWINVDYSMEREKLNRNYFYLAG